MPIITVRVDIYAHDVVFLVTRNPKIVEEYFNTVKTDRTLKLTESDRESIKAGLGGRCWHGMTDLTVIWIPRQPRKPYDYGCLVHETTHAAVQLLSDVNIEINSKNDEPLAWLIDYIVRDFLKQSRKKS